jgi:archaeal type IV pilus assembly protein PilA
MTPGKPSRDNFTIPPLPAGTPPPKAGDNTLWIILGVLFIGVTFIVPLLIIAGFASGTLGNVRHAWVVQVTADQPDAKTILVTYQGGQDAGSLGGITASITDSRGQVQIKSLGSAGGTTPPDPGQVISFDGDFSGKDLVIVTGDFTDGQNLLLLDTSL